MASLVPVGLGRREKGAATGDGEDAHLFADHFVNDAVGTDDELAKAVDIRRDVEEALVRDGATHQGRVGQQIDAILDLGLPTCTIFKGQGFGDSPDDVAFLFTAR